MLRFEFLPRVPNQRLKLPGATFSKVVFYFMNYKARRRSLGAATPNSSVSCGSTQRRILVDPKRAGQGYRDHYGLREFRRGPGLHRRRNQSQVYR